MKIVIAGGYGAFMSKLVERLNREGNEVFTISGKHHKAAAPTAGKYINYDFDMKDDSVRFVLSSVVPDAVIFLGAADTNFSWKISQQDSMDYLSGLSNILILSEELKIRNFIYISSHEVYGTKRTEEITENADKDPEDLRSLVVSQGEDLCIGFNKTRDMNCVVLRIASLYGSPDNKGESDFAVNMCRNILNAKDVDRENLTFSPTYITDAVDAVYRVMITKERKHDLYNVSGPVCKYNDALSVAKKLAMVPDITYDYVEDEGEDEQNLSLDCTRFRVETGYRALVDINKGMKRIFKELRKDYEDEVSKQARALDESESGSKKFTKVAKYAIKKIAPFLENMALFLLFALLAYYCRDIQYIKDIDFMLFYIIFIAITFGVQQAAISILVSSIYFVWIQMSFDKVSVMDIIVDYSNVIQILQYFAIGIIVGHTRDSLRHKIMERDDTIDLMQKELDDIYAINESNIRIKNVLDERLTNYGDSLAKIYSIVAQLNALEPDKIMFSAIDVIKNVMHSKDVSIYLVQNNAKICRLIAASSDEARPLKKSIRLYELGELGAAMIRNEVFVNRAFDPDMPLMAAPVMSNGVVACIVMIWNIELEKLTLYNINLFSILSKMISTSIEKAYEYMEGMRPVRYVEGTMVLNSNEFGEILNIHREAEKNGSASCTIFRVEMGNESLAELGAKLHAQLRTNDYIGLDEDGRLTILLANTDDGDSAFAIDRLSKNGIGLHEVNLNV